VALSAAASRAALAGERLALEKKAFSLGELDLAEFIRVRASASEARLDLVRAENSLNAARARLNQSKGILP
jgi:outer membrane protein TolC